MNGTEMRTEDDIAREMARVVYDKVLLIADTQQEHSRRLVSVETKIDDVAETQKKHGHRLTNVEGKLRDHGRRLVRLETKIDEHGVMLKEHGVMLKEHGNLLREILARLPEQRGSAD